MTAVRPAALRGGVMLKLLVFLTVVFAVAALTWMLLLPHVVTRQLRKRTGFEASVSSLMANPFTGRLLMRGVVLANPPTFPRPEFLQVREFEADAELFTLLTDKPVFTRIKLDIALVALVKRADGRNNAEVFRSYLMEEAPVPARSAPAQPFLIRKLEVRLDRFLLADHTRRDPVVREYAIKLDRTFTNVSDLQQIVLPGSLDQLFALTSSLGTLLPDEITQAIDGVLRSGGDRLREFTRRNPPKMGGFTDALEESKKP